MIQVCNCRGKASTFASQSCFVARAANSVFTGNDTFLAQTRRHRKFTVAVVLSHEEQLRTIQHQLALVYKLSVSSTLAVHLLTAVKSWQGQLVKGKPHPLGACSTAIGSVLLQQMIPVLPPEAKTAAETVLAGDLEEVARHFSHCSARVTAKKDSAILDVRIHLQSSLLPHLASFADAIVQLEGERLGPRPLGPLARKARRQ